MRACYESSESEGASAIATVIRPMPTLHNPTEPATPSHPN